ncbi:MAG: glycosyltransferase, partial [Thermoanaerobaculia bacterium]
RTVAGWHPEARLVIAGPGERRHIEELRSWLMEEGLERVAYVGSLDGQEKLSMLARAAVVVLPSRNENYGMVVAEALACATPVITTVAVPWPAIVDQRCGWRVAISADAIATALGEALALNSDQLNAMGGRGRKLVEKSHSTETAAAEMESAYTRACETGGTAR